MSDRYHNASLCWSLFVSCSSICALLQVRGSYAFQEIRAVMQRSDFETIQCLYDFTEQALKMSGTGRLEDLESWLSGTFAEGFKHLFKDPRPWCRRSFGQPPFKEVRIGDEVLKSVSDNPSTRRKQGTHWIFAFAARQPFHFGRNIIFCTLHLWLQAAASKQAGVNLLHAVWTALCISVLNTSNPEGCFRTYNARL